MKLEGIFLNGLKSEMQELVYMMKPQSLPELIAVALSMETSTLRKVMQKELLCVSTAKLGVSEGRIYTSIPLTSWKTRATVSEVNRVKDKPGIDKVTSKLPQRPQKHHTNAELDDMRRRSICFKCQGKWFHGHECPNKELQVLTILNDFVAEVLQEHRKKEEMDEVSESQLMTLSFSSFMGISSLTTIKMKGQICRGDVLIMLDSGATHNFITPNVASKLKLPVTSNPHLNIVLGT